MKHDLTTGTWQDDTGCPVSIILAASSDVVWSGRVLATYYFGSRAVGLVQAWVAQNS